MKIVLRPVWARSTQTNFVDAELNSTMCLDHNRLNRTHETMATPLLQLPTCFANTEPYGVKLDVPQQLSINAAIDEDQGLQGGITSPQPDRVSSRWLQNYLSRLKKCFLKTLRPCSLMDRSRGSGATIGQ